jgi:MFS transporter, DHA2 family, multidrug resistance protein
MMAAYLNHYLGRAQGHPGAYGLVYRLMGQQAALLAYIDIFRWTAVLSFLCAGIVWFFDKPPDHATMPEGIH